MGKPQSSIRPLGTRPKETVPVYQLTDELRFPPPEEADQSGLLAVGGDLSPKRLLLAYQMGIFPWYEAGLPILWHSPDPRMVLLPSQFRISRSLRGQLRNPPFEIRLDTAFSTVIRACASALRPEGDGTWITEEMMDAYKQLFELGYAHSAEAWADDELVGGLYGVSLGGCFFGESMFAHQSNASKIAFASLVEQLVDWKFDLIDCQVHTGHLERLGATLWERSDFLAALKASLDRETRRGPWRLGV